MICIYHSRDLDGYTSGAIVKRKYPEAKLIGFDYGQYLPYDEIPKGEPIIMIDVSLKMPEMYELAKHSNWQLTWIDHHISAINDYKAFVGGGETFMNTVLEDGISACEGGWNYLFPGERMPMAVLLLGEYDTWRNQDLERWENKILPFQFGIRMRCNSAETFPVELLNQNENPEIAFRGCGEIITIGKSILEYQRDVNFKACKSAFEMTFKGHSAIALNGGGFNSDVFKSVYDPEKHDLMMPFMFNGKFWTISLYTTHDHIDCSLLAKSMGGGGHKKAAGFQVNDIRTIFENI